MTDLSTPAQKPQLLPQQQQAQPITKYYNIYII